MQKLKTTDAIVKSTVAKDTITAITFMRTCAIFKIIVAITISTTAVAISIADKTKQFDAIVKCNFGVAN